MIEAILTPHLEEHQQALQEERAQYLETLSAVNDTDRCLGALEGILGMLGGPEDGDGQPAQAASVQSR
jgi:hypothetical protein